MCIVAFVPDMCGLVSELLIMQMPCQAPEAKRQKEQPAAAFPSSEAQSSANALVQYILPKGGHSSPRHAAIDLLHELAALQAVCCDQTFLGQAWEVMDGCDCMLAGIYIHRNGAVVHAGASQRAVDTVLFFQACKQPRRKWHNWFYRLQWVRDLHSLLTSSMHFRLLWQLQ